MTLEGDAMSWSVIAIGTPEKVAEYLDSHSSGLSGQSKVEYDDAKSHLIGLIKENFVSKGYAKRYPGMATPLVKLTASGHGSSTNGDQDNRTCQVQIETFYSKLLV
jgi:hypothetical protein